jgi:hypothetical protein
MRLNGFVISLSDATFFAGITNAPDNTKVQSLRRKNGNSWFYLWDSGSIYAIHKRASRVTCKSREDLTELRTSNYLPLLASRLVDSLSSVFSVEKPDSFRPFRWIKPTNLMQQCLRGITGLPAVIDRFVISPRYELDTRVVNINNDSSFISLMFQRSMRWRIYASLSELEDAGVSTTGLYVVRKRREAGKRNIVGQVKTLNKGLISLADSFDGISEIDEKEVLVEGNLSSFSYCMRLFCGRQYERFVSNYERLLQQHYNSDIEMNELYAIEEKLVAASPIYLGGGISATITGPLEYNSDNLSKSILFSPEVEYCFNAERTQRHRVAWEGLTQYGPFSRDTFPNKTPTIAVFFPDSIQGDVENYLATLRDGMVFAGKKSAYKDSMAATYRFSKLNYTHHKIPFLDEKSSDPGRGYKEAVEKYLQEGGTADAAIVAIIDEHADYPDSINPYLIAKAHLMMGGIPVQEIKHGTMMEDPYQLQYINQDVSVATYAKMSGTPWTVNHKKNVNEEIIIGMGTCSLQASRFSARERFIGITTVFYGDGSYLLSNLSKECSYDEYPAELKAMTLSVLKKVQARNNWQPGETVRIVFHISKPLKNIEVAEITSECVKQMYGEKNVEFAFLTVSKHHPYLLIDEHFNGVERYGKVKGKFVPQRGTIAQVDTYSRLLAVQSPYQIKAEKTGIPRPLLLTLHKDSTYRDLRSLSEQVLRFTSMTWKSTRPASVPVTILYSEEIAELLGRLRYVKGWSSTVLNGRLETSRWFL